MAGELPEKYARFHAPERGPARWARLVVAAAVALGIAGIVGYRYFASYWPTYRSPDGSFSIDLPKAPVLKDEKGTDPTGPVVFHHFAHGSQWEDEFYEVFYGDYPEPIPADRTEAFLDKVRDNLTAFYGKSERIAARVTSSRAATLQGSPGRDVVCSAFQERATLNFRVFLVKNRRLYVLTTVVHEHHAGENDARFLGSFRLLGS